MHYVNNRYFKTDNEENPMLFNRVFSLDPQCVYSYRPYLRDKALAHHLDPYDLGLVPGSNNKSFYFPLTTALLRSRNFTLKVQPFLCFITFILATSKFVKNKCVYVFITCLLLLNINIYYLYILHHISEILFQSKSIV